MCSFLARPALLAVIRLGGPDGTLGGFSASALLAVIRERPLAPLTAGLARERFLLLSPGAAVHLVSGCPFDHIGAVTTPGLSGARRGPTSAWSAAASDTPGAARAGRLGAGRAGTRPARHGPLLAVI